MIYLISKNKTLFISDRYKESTMERAMQMLLPLHWVQLDTETEGLDAHTKKLLTIQLGNKNNQIVFDWQTMTNAEKLQLKEYLESDRIFIGWNLMFDLIFLYVQDIWVKHVWDGMIVDKLIFLGYPTPLGIREFNACHLKGYAPVYNKEGEIVSTELSYSLKAAAMRWCGIDIDKSVRGKIINDGLTEEVVVYAAGDVMYLEDIKAKQEEEIDKQNLQQAVKIECEFLKSLAYFKYCGVHLDITKWQAKMAKDLQKLNDAVEKLNEWVVNWDMTRPDKEEWDTQYPELNLTNQVEIDALVEKLLKAKYRVCPQENLKGPEGQIIHAYRKKIDNQFTQINRQGDLFSGFDTRPKCKINWGSSAQVIPLFEKLGINVMTFDKKTKKQKKSVEAKLLKPQKDKFPILPIYLQYTEAAKVVSSFGQNWLNAINPKTGRVHAELHPIGTDTARVSSGGGVYKLNLQNLPNDAVTRACFTAEKGNKWISADYQSQESRIIASVSKDEAMIDLFEHGCGDVHSLVAKMSYPEVIGDCPVEEIRDKFHSYRQDAKGIEFAINYGGDANTIANNKGIPLEEAKIIYNNFMKGFPGVKSYQDYCRAAVVNDGYILMNPYTKHRSHVYDRVELARIASKMDDPDFWSYYYQMKNSNPDCDTVKDVAYFRRRVADLGKNSINYRMNIELCPSKIP